MGEKKAEEAGARKTERSSSGKKQQRAAPTAEQPKPKGQLGVGGGQSLGVGGSSARGTGASGGQLGVGRATGAREGLSEVSGTSLLRSPGPASPSDPERYSSARKPGVSQHSYLTTTTTTRIIIIIIIIINRMDFLEFGFQTLELAFNS